jgi:cyclopropane fatty-acyl-phospholipid synthase-like methyltransferase
MYAVTDTERDSLRREFFDRAAQGWGKRHYPPELLDRTEKLIGELDIARGMTILDVGCGRGVILPILRKRAGRDGRLIALDASAPMLAGVARRDKGAWALHARAESIPLLDGYVDMVVCFSAFPHFSDHPAVAREFYRVLKQGGEAHILHLVCRERINCCHDGHEAVHGDHLPDADAMRAMFTDAGFRVVAFLDAEDRYVFSVRKDRQEGS